MSLQYSIGQLARAAEVPTSTIRYYERIGLLAPSGRSAAGYRFYGRGAVEQIGFIRAAQAAGFGLDDIGSLIQARDESPEPCPEVRKLIDERLAVVERKLADLSRVKRYLRAAKRRCGERRVPARCNVLEELAESAARRKAPRSRREIRA